MFVFPQLFIGLGFPYEGPAPLEAIAHGCVFINPKFSPPHSSQNTKFFKGKPTMRKVNMLTVYENISFVQLDTDGKLPCQNLLLVIICKAHLMILNIS